ncbi:translation initiation factor IF-2-like [Catharus ustulatus]|uniref:translation initiation factor IF-2-like n=1 Tax=Catharus ustulatus TaxID=91951 RepID=UPI00140C7629|nr:translation initiation factor IF-2-like [Catharus ustulatus]
MGQPRRAPPPRRPRLRGAGAAAARVRVCAVCVRARPLVCVRGAARALVLPQRRRAREEFPNPSVPDFPTRRPSPRSGGADRRGVCEARRGGRAQPSAAPPPPPPSAQGRGATPGGAELGAAGAAPRLPPGPPARRARDAAARPAPPGPARRPHRSRRHDGQRGLPTAPTGGRRGAERSGPPPVQGELGVFRGRLCRGDPPSETSVRFPRARGRAAFRGARRRAPRSRRTATAAAPAARSGTARRPRAARVGMCGARTCPLGKPGAAGEAVPARFTVPGEPASSPEPPRQCPARGAPAPAGSAPLLPGPRRAGSAAAPSAPTGGVRLSALPTWL